MSTAEGAFPSAPFLNQVSRAAYPAARSRGAIYQDVPAVIEFVLPGLEGLQDLSKNTTIITLLVVFLAILQSKLVPGWCVSQAVRAKDT